MSTFSVLVEMIEVRPHPNADRLELARVADYSCVVPKDVYKTGDLVAYIPEAATVPLEVQQKLGVEGKLAGSKKDRVKAVKLRGVLSQGLVYPAKPEWTLGQDVGEELGITKYEPVVPAHFAGNLCSAFGLTLSYDIENIKKHPEAFNDGETVVITEKLHGTWMCVGFLPESHAEIGHLLITSKGLSSKGFVFKNDDEANEGNVYVKTAKRLSIPERLLTSNFHDVIKSTEPIYILGELFGKGIQDLDYASEHTFRVFDIYVGFPGKGKYLSNIGLEYACHDLGLERVPVLYVGPYSRQVVDEYTNGKETISGKSKHVREGVVIRPAVEVKQLGLPSERLQLKSVSEAYLLRGGEVTEFN